MPADASIYGLLREQRPIEGPLDTYGKALNLRALMTQNRLQDLQAQDTEQTIGEKNAFREGLRGLAPGESLESAIPKLMQVAPQQAIALQQQLLTQKKLTGDIAHTSAQTNEITAGHIAGAFAALAKGGGSDESVRNAHEMMVPLVGEERANAVTQQLMAMPAETRLAYAVAQAGQHKTGQEALKLFFPQAHMQDTGGQVTPVSTSTMPGGPAPGTPIPGGVPLSKTETPEGKASRLTRESEGRKNRDTRLLVAGLDENGQQLNAGKPGETIDLATVSPSDMQAAYRYFTDGTLPPNMGRGTQGTAESRRIRDIAAQISQNLGVAPEDVRANQVSFKGAGTALTQLMRRESQIGANVRNFDFNADQVLQLSDRVDRSGTPVINAWLNAGRRSVAGNPELSAFDVAVKTTVNEFAQIVGGTTAGASTEGEKQKAEKLLNAQQTPDQIKAVINQMRIESQNRMKSFADQKQQVLGNMRAGGQPQPAPSPAAAPKQEASKPGKLVPAKGAVQDGYRFKGGDPSKPESWEKV